jgi:hypothetical protein
MAAYKTSSDGDRPASAESASGPSRLQQYLNAKVMVYYNSQSSYTDSGRVTYLDPSWLELTKENGERLLIPIMAVRLVKILEALRQTDDAGTLLRPLEGPPQLRP